MDDATRHDNIQKISFCPICGRKLKNHWQPMGEEFGMPVTTYYCQTGGHRFDVIDDAATGYQRLEAGRRPGT